MKRVLVIATSPRKGSNSESLADEFIRGAINSGHAAEKICLREKRIGFCQGCLACQSAQKCVIEDDAVEITEKMFHSDVIVFATPIYYYEMSGQMKTMLDRCNPLFPSDYAFRGVYLLAASADGDPASMDGAVKGLSGWVECFEKTELRGVVRGVGVDSPGAVENQPALLRQAYEMGKAL